MSDGLIFTGHYKESRANKPLQSFPLVVSDSTAGHLQYLCIIFIIYIFKSVNRFLILINHEYVFYKLEKFETVHGLIVQEKS